MKTKLTISDVELIYKKTELPAVKIMQSSDAVEPCRSTIPDGQIAHREFFGMLMLNRANRILRKCIVSMGGVSTTVVDPKIVMQFALLANASGIILFHNHPAGDVKPSQQDIQLTKRIGDACSIMDVSLLDHIIISSYPEASPNYFSFADDGLL